MAEINVLQIYTVSNFITQDKYLSTGLSLWKKSSKTKLYSLKKTFFHKKILDIFTSGET